MGLLGPPFITRLTRSLEDENDHHGSSNKKNLENVTAFEPKISLFLRENHLNQTWDDPPTSALFLFNTFKTLSNHQLPLPTTHPKHLIHDSTKEAREEVGTACPAHKLGLSNGNGQNGPRKKTSEYQILTKHFVST